MFTTKHLAALIGVAAMTTAAAHGSTLFQLDFDNAITSPTQSGWESFSDSGDGTASNKTVNYSGYTEFATGNISIKTQGVTHTRNYNNGGSAAPNFPGTDLDKVYNDLILNNGDAGTAITLTISGLKSGTYDFTTHHLTQGGELSTKSTFDLLVQDADSPAFSQDQGTFEMGRGDGTTYWDATVVDFTVTSNGVDPVLVQIKSKVVVGGGQGAWVGISGLEIAVPEPSSLALLAMGGLMIARRRRG